MNAYAEKDPSDGEYWIYKRLGIAPNPLFSIPAGFPGGVYQYQPFGQIISVVGGNIYVAGNIVGTIQTGYQCWFETVNSNPQTVVIMNQFGGVIYTPVTQAVVEITDPVYPSQTVPGWAYLDGTLYVMDLTGNIWGTHTVNNAAVWDGLNVIPASTKADQGVFLATQLTYVIAFKQWTTQIFYDAENPTGSPLSPVPDAQIPYGCMHANSVQKIDEILLWMTSNQTISPQIAIMENLSPKIISTPSIERVLDNILINTGAPVINDRGIVSWSLKHAGHRFYGLTLTLMNITLVYDIDQGLWYLWLDSSGNYWPVANFTYTQPTENTQTTGAHLGQIIGSNTAGVEGSIYEVDGDYEYPNDLGTLYSVDIYTPNFTGGTTRRKTLNNMYFEADQVAGSTLQARYSDNDYKSWTNFRTIDLNRERPFLDQEGTFTRRAYHFRHRANTQFRIKASDLQMDLGTL